MQQMLDMKKKHQDTKKRKLEDEAPKPEPKNRVLRDNWKNGRPWLKFENGKMFCTRL